jgi:hypothetical protein
MEVYEGMIQRACGVDFHGDGFVAAILTSRGCETRSFEKSLEDIEAFKAWLRSNKCKANSPAPLPPKLLLDDPAYLPLIQLDHILSITGSEIISGKENCLTKTKTFSYGNYQMWKVHEHLLVYGNSP